MRNDNDVKAKIDELYRLQQPLRVGSTAKRELNAARNALAWFLDSGVFSDPAISADKIESMESHDSTIRELCGFDVIRNGSSQ